MIINYFRFYIKSLASFSCADSINLAQIKKIAEIIYLYLQHPQLSMSYISIITSVLLSKTKFIKD